MPIEKLPLAEPLGKVLGRADLTPDVRQIALKRWLSISPADARKMALQIIDRGAPDLGQQAMDTLTLLPDKTLKEVDGAVVGRLERCAPHCTPQTLPLLVKLIQRYASARSAARLRRVYPGLTFYDDDSEAAFIAYFLRVDPAFGKQALARRLREKSGSSAVDLLSEISRLGFARQAEPELIATLSSKDAFNVMLAARALSRYGSKAAERALYQRLSAWSKKWRGREKELERPLIGHTEGGDEGSLESELRRAIVQGRGWLTDRTGFEKLRALLLRDGEKQQLDTPMEEWNRGVFTLRFTRTDADELRVDLAHYELDSLAAVEQKLSQFPRGTHFVWRPYDDVPGELERARKLVAKYGHTLTRP